MTPPLGAKHDGARYGSWVGDDQLESLRLEVCTNAGVENAEWRATSPNSVLVQSRRTEILLIGSDKTGNDRWYEEYVPIADRVFKRHLQELEMEEEGDQ